MLTASGAKTIGYGVTRGSFLTTLAQPQAMFAGCFLFLSLVFIAAFNVQVRTDAHAAEKRFDALIAADAPRRAAGHGERALKMRRTDGASEEALAPLKASLAGAQVASRRYARAASLYEQALSSKWARAIDERKRAGMENDLARAHIAAGQIDKAVEIYAQFLNSAGDEAARGEIEASGTIEAVYAQQVDAAADLFAESLKPTGSPDKFSGPAEILLATAGQMGELGAFYAMRDEGLYAAAGLLSSAYQIRRQLLGADHQDTVRITLVLGPVYGQMGRLRAAEQLYLDAFHAQEKSKGANNPDLSLYIKLLVDIYQQQGRQTEAQALAEHLQGLFRDAFGAQRYAINRDRDRRTDVDRPVSQYFVLDKDYAPRDLVRASDFSIPVSKDYTIDEMKLRLASDLTTGSPVREDSLPARLAQLISLCRSESRERISLRSGYRAWRTQRDLFSRNGDRGTVTPPGMSEHQLGLAADIDVNGRLMRRSDRTYQCFEENAYQFGFILSYPPGNNYLPGEDSFEPWHWRYVGVKTAQLYREAGPINKPQEFLAALPCYREKAASGGLALSPERDLCLEGSPGPTVAAATSEPSVDTSDDLPNVTRKAARKLNNPASGATPR